MTPMPLQNDIREQVANLVAKANAHYGLDMYVPEIRFDLKGRTAGLCYYEHAGKRAFIRFNHCILSRYEDQFRARTVPHEVAHFVVAQRFGGYHACKRAGIRPHGKEWKEVCEFLGMTDVTRCHSYTTKPANGVSFTYVCDCREHEMSSRKHNKILQGYRYTCRSCKGELRRKGATVARTPVETLPTPKPAPKPAPRTVRSEALQDLLSAFRARDFVNVAQYVRESGQTDSQIRALIGRLRKQNLNIQTVPGRRGCFALRAGSYR